MKTLGIIGFGDFGRFMAQHLAPHFKVKISSSRDCGKEAKALGCGQREFAEVCGCDVVVPSVPVQHLAGVLEKMSPLLKPGALVADVCSVKIKPIKLMQDILPGNVEIVATHPLFGPQSGKNGINGLRVVFWPVRCKNSACFEDFLRDKLGLKVFQTSPEAHDREMAYVQGLNHFVARALARMGLHRGELETPAYEKLCEMHNILREDSEELFYTIERENPFAAGVRASFLEKLQELEREIWGGKPLPGRNLPLDNARRR